MFLLLLGPGTLWPDKYAAKSENKCDVLCRRVGELLASIEQSSKDGNFTICVNTLMSRLSWGACWIFRCQLYLIKHIDFIVLIYVWDRWKKIQKMTFQTVQWYSRKQWNFCAISTSLPLKKLQVCNTRRVHLALVFLLGKGFSLLHCFTCPAI